MARCLLTWFADVSGIVTAPLRSTIDGNAWLPANPSGKVPVLYNRDLQRFVRYTAAICLATVLGAAALVADSGVGLAQTRKGLQPSPGGVGAVVAPGAPLRGLGKVYRRPLLRAGRIQYCLSRLDRYDARITGRETVATVRALRRLRDDWRIKADNVMKDWALHAVLWRQCRAPWLAEGGSIDRFGHAALTAGAQPMAEFIRRPVEEVANAGRPTSGEGSATTAFCLPPDLRDVLARAQGQRRDIAACELPCLAPVADFGGESALALQRRLGITWCKACVRYKSVLSLDEITRIEQAGNLTLCPEPRQQSRLPAGQGARLTSDLVRGLRGLFRRDVRPAEPHNALAVIIGNANYANRLPPRPAAARDAAAMRALLVERLGFRPSRVIELKDATLADLEGIFGTAASVRGLLAERLKDGARPPVFIYYSGLGSISGENGDAYLLPVNAVLNQETRTGLRLDMVYQNLTRMGAGPATVVLEADFAADAAGPVIAPNAPGTRAWVLPKLAIRGLTVFTAADRDQRTLEDPEYGMGLFTRHLIAGLSGYADEMPLGNADGVVDTSEAFVYAAHRTGVTARKVFGVLQHPSISQGRPLLLGPVGAALKSKATGQPE